MNDIEPPPINDVLDILEQIEGAIEQIEEDGDETPGRDEGDDVEAR